MSAAAALVYPSPHTRPHHHRPRAPPSLPPPLEESDDLDANASAGAGCFAIARVNGVVHLVQLSVPATPVAPSALTTLNVKIFRHEFIHIFRFLEARTLHPGELHVIETVPPRAVCVDGDEEDGEVALARDVLARMSRLSAPVFGSGFGKAHGHVKYPSGAGHDQRRVVRTGAV
ncbi:hypothetical protein MKEN_00572400 [Mycena kentingensis (nom. inval.)]|nr:hypothetical protein MKEN_00572400 [Mycena kentingensis (nom. inval.)]